MQHPWFKEWGWIYRPLAWPGWVAVLLTVMFCVQVFVAVDRHSHSASDTLYGIFPFVVPAFGVLLWVASKTSKTEGH
jgi:drug/metabolite transporter (DMT)-like permease